MVDYTVGISASTTMMIRDTGGNVEFWLRTGSQSWNNDQPWSYGANGGNSGVLKFRLLRGGQWQKFGEVYVGYDQDVRFSVSGTGIGFPSYDFIHHISRSTVPGPPYIHTTEAVSDTEILVQFNAGHDGGSAILEWQIGYGGFWNYPEQYVSSGGSSVVGPFNPGERVYFWTRGRNAIGWGAWSLRTEATTWRIPDSPRPITFSNVTQISVRTQFLDRFDGGDEIEERVLGYGLDPDEPTDFEDVDGNTGINDLTNLVAGETYYFWGRLRNSVGWSPWSDRREINLIAGAQVKVGSVWKRAVPYKKVSGTWKVVRPWVRIAGVWKETSV